MHAVFVRCLRRLVFQWKALRPIFVHAVYMRNQGTFACLLLLVLSVASSIYLLLREQAAELSRSRYRIALGLAVYAHTPGRSQTEVRVQVDPCIPSRLTSHPAIRPRDRKQDVRSASDVRLVVGDGQTRGDEEEKFRDSHDGLRSM
jgi:hypothetical protein